MDKIKTLQDIYESYSKQAEELRHKIAELNIELEHAIFMKEAYKRMISIRGYVDTDKVRERVNRKYGVSAEGKDVHETYSKEKSRELAKLYLNSLYGKGIHDTYSKEEKDYIANDITVTKEALKTLVKTGDEDEH